MHILSVYLRNIKSHRETTLEFAPGINVLSGPNGVGKSTVFEAIGYALFGVEAQKFVGNADRFLSIGSKKGEIAVVFELEQGKRYRVSRTVGTAGRWLLCREVGGAFEVEEHKDGVETEDRLKKLLGLDNGRPLAEQFERVIGPFQNDFLGPFIIRQPSRRRDEFDAILGIDAWRRTFTETAGLGRTIRGKIEVLETEIALRREQVAVLPEKREEQQKVRAELESVAQERDRKTLALKELESLLREMDGREQILAGLRNEVEKLTLRIADGRQKIEIQKQRVRDAGEAAKVLEATRPAMEAFESAEKRLLDLRLREKERRDMETGMANLERQAAGLKERCQAEMRSIDRARSEIAAEEERIAAAGKVTGEDAAMVLLAGSLPDLRDRLAALRNRQGLVAGRRHGLEEGRVKLSEGTCPFFQETCLNVEGRPAGDVFSTGLASLEKEQILIEAEMEKLLTEEGLAEQAAAKLRETRGRQRALEEQSAALARRRKDLDAREQDRQALLRQQQDLEALLQQRKKELQAFAGLEQAIEGAEGEKTANREGRDAFFAHKAQAAEWTNLQEILEKYCKLLNDLETEKKTQADLLQRTIDDYDQESHAGARKRKESLLGELGTMGQQIAGLEKDCGRLTEEIARLEEIRREMTSREALAAGWARKEKLVKYLRNRVFKNVSSHLSERFREEISQRADRIYRTISEADEELTWADNYQVVLRDLHDGQVRERSDDQLSGGQMMSAVVALRLALLQTIGARIAFFDEPTSHLDGARRENLARAFRAIDVGREEVTEHWYDQLFLISHDLSFTEITDQVVSLGE
ncbi:MAG: SMC family ATPase [Syntrophotaleaceae bacterium]